MARDFNGPWVVGDELLAPDGSMWMIVEIKDGKLRAECVTPKKRKP